LALNRNKSWSLKHLLVLLGLLLVAPFAVAQVGEIVYGFDVVYPKRLTTLKFSHKKHSKQECQTCHKYIIESDKASDRNLPAEVVCQECHKENTRTSPRDTGSQAKCSLCHSDYDVSLKNLPARSHWPESKIKYNHKVHVNRMIACSTCHAGVEESDSSGGRHLPHMGTCTSCHKLNGKENTCTLCHVSKPSGAIIKTRFNGVKLVPSSGTLNHHLDWGKRHAKEAKVDKKTCDNCHVQRDCNTCHDGVMRPYKIHPNDYATLHAIDARKNTPNCQSCHRLQSFCVDCHRKLAVSPEAEHRPARVQYHPQGWGDCKPTPTHHGYQAKRNLTGCVSCHREADCLRCHKSGSPCGGNVKIHGHLSNDKLSRMQNRNPRLCKKCHENL